MSTRVTELAEQIKETGQRSSAELPALLQKAVLLAEDNSQDILTRALAHRAAGNALQLLNEFQSALDNYNRAASLLETLDEPIELGRTLHAKVGMLFSLSRFDELFACSVRARELFEQCSDRKRLARLDVNLAHAYHRLGRHREALASSERALAILEEIHDAEGFVAASINSAVTLTAMHEFDRAEERYRKALHVATGMNMASWMLLSRYNLAYLRYLGGDTASSLRELETVRREYELANDEWMICQCWLDESEILLEIGDMEESIRAARKARALGKKLGLNSEIAKSLLYEAAAGLRLGRCDDAMDLLERAMERFAAEGDKVSTAVSKLQIALFRGERGDATALVNAASARSALADSGLPHRLALADVVIGRIQRAAGNLDCAIDSFKSALGWAENGRSQWMQFHASYELGLSLNRKKDPEGSQLFKRAESLLDSLWNRLGSDELKMTFLGDRENVYTYLVRSTLRDSADSDSAFALSEKARSRVLRETLLKEKAQISTAEIRARLSPDETVVEYFIMGDDLCIFVLRDDGLICVERQGVVDRLKTAWQNLDRHITSCSVKWEKLAPAQKHLEATAQRHLQSLYDDMIAPVQSQLRGNIIFSPHGFLHSVPLHALHDGKNFLAERHQIAYTPSASLYCAAAPMQEFANPLLIAFSTSRHSSSIDEVEEIGARFDGAEILINPSLAQLRQAFEKARVLVHIAGHAGIDAVGGKLSWIETVEGRLTSRDLADMRIQARTLVITGCQTARRIIQPGDEWLGLMRSFYLSGAGTIVSALWDIRDESARRFAGEFYRTFDGKNAPMAVQGAAAAVRQWRAHPYFWAGFGAFVRKRQGNPVGSDAEIRLEN